MNEIIAKRRKELKLSQEEVAKRIGISQQHFSVLKRAILFRCQRFRKWRRYWA